MSMERLSQQVEAYVDWKRELVREITRYRSWLAGNRLMTEAVDAKLERALRQLRSDHITLAFVGEFSRGKTELINSLFFSDFGQRMLPSQAGRTTMCPTELFFDPRSERAYIRLLPIETRLSEASVAQFKRVPKHWVNIPLDASDPQNMAQAFAQVAKTRPMRVEDAIQLGFHPDMLEPSGSEGQVLVPAWRHAMVNFDHPLLRKGLRILDTPGLNALGSEPELTLSMLPSAQAIIFMLSADAGVTASDMEIWQQHIRQLDDSTQASLFAVLNKIDVLWDDLAGDVAVQRSILSMQAATARLLGISHEDVLPLSAKQALLAKVRKDEKLLERSQLGALEDLLCARIVAQKERLIADGIVNQVLGLLQNSQHLLSVRLEKAREQQGLLLHSQEDNNQTLLELAARTRQDHALHHKRLLGLKTNQRLLSRLAEPMQQHAGSARVQQHIDRLAAALKGSWTTVGINQAIVEFFASLSNDLSIIEHEAGLANKMVAAIYRRHNEENPLHGIDAPQFDIQRHARELARLQAKADQFRLHPRTLFTEQRALERRFFATLVQEVIGLMQRLREDAGQWGSDTLLPLMQHTLEHKQLLETHMLRLKALTQETHKARQRGELLARYIELLEQQLGQAADMLRALRRPAPLQRQGKVVNLPGASRQGADSAG
jgi:replication fork clamp-binding protein CrfC